MGAHRHRDAAGRGAGGARRHPARRARPRSSTRAPTASSRSAAGCSTRRGARDEAVARRLAVRRARPAGDRRLLRGAGRGRAASEPTDFDIYALADLAQPALRRARQLPAAAADAAVLEGARQHLLLRAWSACRCRSRVSLGAALLLNSPLARFKGFFRTALFAPVVTTLVAVAVVWRYLLHTRYGLLNYALGRARHRIRSTGSAIRTGRCRRSSCSRCGRTSATT